ncbi:MAG: Ig-like domain-containing protein [Clostridia bacterium]|nr:Ig-like domain-containing protein [Clostridia bacterium]
MKRILYCIFVSLLCMVCLTACGKSKDSSSNSESTETSVNQPEKQISFVEKEIVVGVGESIQAEVETAYANVYIAWSVRDPELATVSNKGVITGIAEGQTICYAKFGGETAMCLVKIIPPKATPLLSLSVPYENDEITLYKGDEIGLNVSVKLGDSILDDATLAYEVDNTDVANVEDGKVVGKMEGSTTLIVRATYEGETVSLSLTVNIVEK